MKKGVQKLFITLSIILGGLLAVLLVFGDDFAKGYLHEDQISYISLVQKFLLVLFYSILSVLIKNNLNHKEKAIWRIMLYASRILILVSAIDFFTIIFGKIF